MLKVSKKELLKALSVLGKVAIAKNRTNSALKCVRMQAVNQQELKLTATNLNEYLSCTFNASEVADNMDVLMPVADVKKFINGGRESILSIEELPGGGVSISEERGGRTLTQEFPAPQASEFPTMPPVPEKLAEINAYFMQAINKVVPSISLTEIRKVLQGILLHPGGIVATDGKQLCTVDYEMPLAENCIMPIPHCFLDSEFIFDSGFGVVKDKESQWITLRIRNWTWTAKGISGTYPDWRQVIPREETLPFRMVLDKKSADGFIEKLKMLKDNPPMHMLKLTISDGKVKAFSEACPGQSVECALSETTGANPEEGILVNRKLLLRALSLGHNVFTCDPAAFSPLVSSGGLGKLIVMTIRVKQENVATEKPQQSINQPITNNMENKIMNNEINTAAEKENNVTAAAEPNNGLKMVLQPDIYYELLNAVDELRVSVRNINEQAASLARKIRDNQVSFRKRERDLRSAREVLEKLKVAGF
ncbi:MAG: hypothetical protein A2Y07_03910 [Planctomycetes bacterium GWF2_50_10]|nr:MAG: hypothetical protein A2Y07_03910 [Planctomycetes bacterium GWF2_50_10]